MGSEIRVTIPGRPQAWQRAGSFVGKSGKPVMFQRKESRSWKGVAQVHMKEACPAPLEGPLLVEVMVVFACPKSAWKKRVPMPRRWHTGRPDFDNICKQVGDAGNGVLWLDDSQIVRVEGRKLIGAQGEPERVEVVVRQLAAEDTSA